jgi:hypothetical protein
MRIDTFQSEPTIDALADRLFAKAAPDKRAALKDRLLALNPHLASTTALPPGTPIVVPDDDGGDDDPNQAQALAAVTALLDAAEAQHASAIADARAAAQNSTTVLATQSIVDAQKADAGLSALVGNAHDTITTRGSELQQTEAFLQSQVAAARQAVTDLSQPIPAGRGRAAGR